MTWIHTRSGLAFDLLDPKPEQVSLADVAWSLGRLSRYTGHGLHHCSVAEHSIRVADLVAADGGDEYARWCALLHDAHEAYLGDVASPIKRVLGDAWKTLEARVGRVVSESLWTENLGAIERERIHKADLADLAAEALRNLPQPPPRPWRYGPLDALARESDLLATGRWSAYRASVQWLNELRSVAPAHFVQAIKTASDQVADWQEAT